MAQSNSNHENGRLFRSTSGQHRLLEKSRKDELAVGHGQPVECLGLTFESEDACRHYFLAKLEEGLEEIHHQLEGVPFTTVDDALARLAIIKTWPMGDEAQLRRLAQSMQCADPSKDLLRRWKDDMGFPDGEIKEIVNLSDPPFYTACPNPFLTQFLNIEDSKTTPQEHEIHPTAFANDVIGSKHGRLYNVHGYHTKVPPDAIVPLIEYYTKPGDIVLDPFAGSGMTAVAVDMSNKIRKNDSDRKTILVELSPVATYIAGNYTSNSQSKVDLIDHFESALQLAEAQCAQYLRTAHTGWPANIRNGQEAEQMRARTPNQFGDIVYTVWSDIYRCPDCGSNVPYWDSAVDLFACELKDVFSCPHCDATLCKEAKFAKRHSATVVERTSEKWFDPVLGQPVDRQKRKPVLISYQFGGARYEKFPDQDDIDLIDQSDGLEPGFSCQLMLGRGSEWGDTWRAGVHLGITHAHHFYTNRSLYAISTYIQETRHDKRLLFPLTATALRLSKMNRYMPQHRNNRNREVVGPLSGTLYVPSISIELNPIIYMRSKAKAVFGLWNHNPNMASFCSTQSATNMSQIPDESIDYIFVDPPFGDNLFYSELNFLWESILTVFTRREPEAIVSPAAKKETREYTMLMESALSECRRILKSGRWITMEFHNSRNAIWSAIHEAIQAAGFVVAGVRVMDKKKGTTKQLTFANAVKQDLLISAYKPDGGLEERFRLEAGAEGGVWDFIRTHLRQLPVFISKGGQAETIAERQNFLLFDRMVAFHVQRGMTVPMSAAEFYAGLVQRFPERDGMFFLPEQVAEYDKKRMSVREILQLEIFVIDESSAIQWLKQQLSRKPQTFQDIHPHFLIEIGAWQKHERDLELSVLLEQNFLRYDGAGEVPSQIHSYLSSSFKELRKLPKDHPSLRAKAKDRWYVPDPNKAGDLERLRERALLREFEEYRRSTLKRIKIFRLEAVRSGFKRAWQSRDYHTIISVARKIPEDVLKEDPKLLMWYDQALTRTEST